MIFIIFLLAFFYAGSAGATVLGDLAATMTAGQWLDVTSSMPTYTANLVSSTSSTEGGHIFDFSNKGCWDSTRLEWYEAGVSHGLSIPLSEKKIVRYVASTNTWSVAWTDDLLNHEYDHNACDSTRGIFYAKLYGGGGDDRAVRVNLATGVKTTLDMNFFPVQITWGFTYFPERDSLVFAQATNGGRWTFYEYKESTGVTTIIKLDNDAPIFLAGDYAGFGIYNPALHHVLFGGGIALSGNACASCFVIMDSKGTLTAINNAPFACAITGVNGDCKVTVDPVSGEYLFFKGDSSTWYKLNVVQTSGGVPGVWTNISGNIPSSPNIFTFGQLTGSPYGWTATPIPNYGVVMFTTCGGQGNCRSGGTPRVILYKHTQSVSGPDADFAARCAAAGVVRCFNFDTTAQLGTQGSAAFGANVGTLNNNVSNCPTTGPSQCGTIDTSVYASGGGALKFVVPTNSQAGGSGQWFGNVSTDLSTRFGGGDTFYVQWRQRFSCTFLYTNCPAGTGNRQYTGGGGWKLAIIGMGDAPGVCQPNGTGCVSSCTELEIVPQNTFQRGILQGYHGCPGTYNGTSYVFEEAFGGSDFKIQNAYVNGCLYSQVSVGNISTCWPFAADEWLTVKVKVQIGAFVAPKTGACAAFANGCYPGSQVEVWLGRNGQSLVKTHSFNLSLNASVDGAQANKWGKIWLLPYNTGKDSSQVHPEAYIWYDELIISRQNIADPGAAPSSDVTPPTVQITSPTVSPTYSIGTTAATFNISMAGIAADETSLNSVTWVNNRGGSGTATGTTSWSIPTVTLQSGVNVITVTAVDGSGNMTVDTLTVTYRVLVPVSFKIQ